AESDYGCSDNRVIQVDGELLFVAANRKVLNSWVFDYGTDSFKATNLTQLSHDLFDKERFPLACTVLTTFKDTQSNMVFLPMENGEMAVLTLDVTANVRGWSLWDTDGWFCDAAVV